MVAGSFTEEYESPVAVERLWNAGALESYILMPKLLPELVAGVDVLQGDGGVGTIVQINFTEAVEDKYSKDRFDVVDAENHVFKYSVVEGGSLSSKLAACTYELKFEPAGNGGSKVKLTLNYETSDDSPLTTEEVGKLTLGLVTTLKTLEGYLLANPTLYA